MTRSLCSDGASIQENIRIAKERIAEAAALAGREPGGVSLMAVTKTVDPLRVNLALSAGISLLGENRVQECCEKYQNYSCNRDAIHFIGHLQSNKIRDIIDKVAVIESVDSIRLADALEKECEKQGLEMPILLEINIGREATKSGFLPEEVENALDRIASSCGRISIKGLMTIPPPSSEDDWLRKMEALYQELRVKHPEAGLTTLSMGTSGDYTRAVRWGSTQVRLGQAIFGSRN